MRLDEGKATSFSALRRATNASAAGGIPVAGRACCHRCRKTQQWCSLALESGECGIKW